MHGRFTEGIGNKCCGRMQKQRDIDHVPVVMGWNSSMDWRDSIENYKNLFHLDVDIKDHKIYVRTDAGCWKIIYKRDKQHFILLHRNYANGRTSLEDVEKVPYHRQGDMAEASTIMKYLKYIRAHDDFKQMMPKDYHKMPRSTKRQKAYYKAAKQREARKSARRVDNLFTMIERKEGIREISFC